MVRPLEIKTQRELDHPAARIVRSGDRKITVGAACLSKWRRARRRDIQRVHIVAGAAEQEVRVVECVLEAGAELDVLLLTDPL